MYFYQISLFLDMGVCFRLQNRNPTVKAVVQQRNAIVEFLVLNWVGEKQEKLRFFLLVWWWWQYFPSIIFECSVCALSKIICQILQFIQTQKLVPMILIRSGPHAICSPEKQTEVNASFAFENGWMGSCRFYHHLRQSRKTIYSSSTFLGSPAA